MNEQNADQMQARRFIVKGRVQGVYFRQNTAGIAASLGLTGWVRNENDGSVSVFAQGTERQLDKLSDKLKNGLDYTQVSSVEEEPAELDLSFTNFSAIC